MHLECSYSMQIMILCDSGYGVFLKILNVLQITIYEFIAPY